MKIARCIVFLFFMTAGLSLLSAQNPYNVLPRTDWENMTVLDSAYMRVQYEMSFRMAVAAYTQEELDKIEFTEDKYLTDKRIIEIGDEVRKDYSGYLEAADLRNRQWEEEGKPLYTSFEGNGNVYPFEVFMFNDGRIRTNSRTLATGPILQWEEEAPEMQWSLSDGRDTVLGYPCMEASLEFAGRSYTAWFSPDIPVPYGPYKFGGLPGLILKIGDDSGHYTWEATGIEQGSWPIYEKEYMFQKASREKSRKVLENMYKGPYAFLVSVGVNFMIRNKDGSFSKATAENDVIMYYDPIELE
ncbi:MAG: GLPGLI family protein [Bacteroidetes bacterium]|uniref:GLPGLI family protein n=1 Tax=Candidatus Merdivivens pullistercoris TaxID=2840873 RepID=A0A9D9NA35_9BACT|nr:GLPGLI family protein [Candidatus Merdivivens pullistercoris]